MGVTRFPPPPMSADSPSATEAPEHPPEPVRETGWLRWIAIVVALGLLVLLGLKAYQWLQGYVVQRHAMAQQETPALAEPQPSLAAPTPAPPVATAQGEPFAPAVTGQAVHRCVRPDGQVVLTNQACPAGSRPDAAPAVAAPSPAAAAISWAGDDPSLHDATCHYLAAEVERLGYEFQQPLPPPVLDLISTRLSSLRGAAAQGGCAPLPKPAAAPGERDPHKVLTERAGAAPKPRR